MKKNVKKKIKIARFVKKIQKIRDVKMLKNDSTTTKNYSVTYYKNLEEFPWHLGLKELKKWQKFFKKKLKKIVKIRIKLLVCSDRLFLSSHGGWGGYWGGRG